MPSRPLLLPRTTMISSCRLLAHRGRRAQRGVTYILANRNATHSVLFAELLTQRRLKMLEHVPTSCCSSSSYAHDDPTHTTRRTEVCLSRLAARARDHGLNFGHCVAVVRGCRVSREKFRQLRKIGVRQAHSLVRRQNCFSPHRRPLSQLLTLSRRIST